MSNDGTDELEYGMTYADFSAAIDRGDLVLADSPLPTDLPPPPAPGESIKVNTSIRLPVEVFKGVKALADERGIKFTHMLAEWIELELREAQRGGLTRADALRAADALAKFLDQAA